MTGPAATPPGLQTRGKSESKDPRGGNVKEQYTVPVLEVIGELREVTAASTGGSTPDLIFSVFGTQPVSS